MLRDARLRTFLILAVIAVVISGAPGVIGQEPMSIEFTHYEGNPILTAGPEGAWDAPLIVLADVVYVDEMFYLFYLGGSNPEGWSVGYATSPDGMTWTKFEGNPILGPDDTIAPFGYRNLAVINSGDQWMMFLGPHDPTMPQQGVIFKATAAAVEGPWTVQEDPILDEERGWEDNVKMVQSAAETEDGYQLYYLGMSRSASFPQLGLATSPDGDVWKRYDNPDTRLPPFGESDPVFAPSVEDTWDNSFVSSVSVRPGENGLEMLYFAASQDGSHIGIGYATSADGIEWTRVGNQPVLTADASLDIDGPWVTELPSMVIVDGTYYLYYTVIEISDFTPLMVNLAIGTPTEE